MFRGKFTHISPVWYTIQPGTGKSQNMFVLQGAQDVDKEWMKEVSEPVNNHKTHIVPRFQILSNENDLLMKLYQDVNVAKELADMIISECM